MKAINVVLGFVIFSIIISMMFAAASNIMGENNVEGSDDFDKLSGEYNSFTSGMGDEDSTAREIIGQTKQGEASSDTSDVSLITGALSGGRLVTNFFTNFENIVHNATGDANEGEAFVDDRIIGAILAIIVIFIAFVILHFIRGFKTET